MSDLARSATCEPLLGPTSGRVPTVHGFAVGAGNDDSSAFGDTDTVPTEAHQHDTCPPTPFEVCCQRFDVRTGILTRGCQRFERHGGSGRRSVPADDGHLTRRQPGTGDVAVALCEAFEPAG